MLKLVLASDAWDPEWNLPLCPVHSNPWFYCSLIKMILVRYHGEDATLFDEAVKIYLEACAAGEPGKIHRRPGGIGGNTSHDELIGAAYLNAEFARECLYYIVRQDGAYRTEILNEHEDRRSVTPFFMFLHPHLKASADFRVSIYSDITWAIHCLFSIFTFRRGSYSGLFKIWVMSHKMSKYKWSGIAWNYWSQVMMFRGLTPREVARLGLSEVPILQVIAPLTWQLPQPEGPQEEHSF